VPSYVILADCDASDGAQAFALLGPPVLAVLCFGRVGWSWPREAGRPQRLLLAVFVAGFLGALAYYSLFAVFVGRCEG
jgi:hypothetical protein